jgi:serine/threonine protein kinase
MSDQTRFDFKEKLHDGRNTVVYRAVRRSDSGPVVLKILKDTFVSELLPRFKREFEIAASMNGSISEGQRIDGVVDAFAFETVDNLPTIVMEDFGGVSLNFSQKVWSVDEFLPLAIQIVEALGQVHSRRVMHKDINPSNIVFNAKTGVAKLIDFGLSTVLPRERVANVNINVLEGTLAYISPEQTGRMNRSVDYRTDFYSLGVTFYEILTGRLPFEERDMLALLHSHMAKQPPSPSEINPNVPVPLSNIMMKLLAKNAEDRYQSAYGLKADLLECQRQWDAKRQIDDFPIGSQDRSDHFQISQKLFGREKEITALFSAYENIRRGGYAVFLFSGIAGIGKSSLASELQVSVTEQNGYFVSGRYVPSQNHIPYSALIESLNSLVQQLLTQSEAELQAWREKLLKILGENGRIITDMIPDARLILGLQPAPPSLAASEEQNRFNITLHDFVCAFMSEEHPLVLFLDNLQWADTASISFLSRFTSSPDLHHFMLIGAYRPNELGEQHPLHEELKQLRDSVAQLQEIELDPIHTENVQSLLVQSLNCSAEEASSLAEVAMTKTSGNPLFIIEFLRAIYNDGLLKFDRNRGGWSWNLSELQMRPLTDSVVHIVSSKINDLPEATQKLLGPAACIGDQFDLSMLAQLSHQTMAETASDLWHALASGLIFPLTPNYVLADQPDALQDVRYAFAHPGIQQGIYTLLPEEEKSSLHWQISQFLLNQIPEGQREQEVFELVNHLNPAFDRMQTTAELVLTARLNLLASQKTSLSAAQEASYQYARQGMKQLDALERQGVDVWKEYYPLVFDLHFYAASASYLTGEYEEMERWSEILLANAASVYDQARVYEMKLYACIAKADRVEGCPKHMIRASFQSAESSTRSSQSYIPTRLNLLLWCSWILST